MKMCFNWKIAAGLGVAGLGMLVLVPNVFAAAVPFLILAACPLSMVVMMRAMSGGGRRGTPETGKGDGSRVDSPESGGSSRRGEDDVLRFEPADQARSRGERRSQT